MDSTVGYVDKLQNLKFSGSDNSVSFDASSLFTNVLLDEPMGLIAGCVYRNSSKRVHPFQKVCFIKLLRFASNGLISYNNKLYKQVD